MARTSLSDHPSGLNTRQLARARGHVVRAARLGQKHAERIHYTQSGARWQYINQHKRMFRGQYPTEADCSSYASGILWDITRRYKLPDWINGESWGGGYTGTLTEHGVRVHGRLMVGDLVFYGGTMDVPGHVAVYIGNGLVFSHGSEGGPYILGINYRSDLRQVRRYL